MSSERSSRIPRLVSEGVVIVVSILLAFAIDAGWDERQERERVFGQLEQVEIDLRSTLANLDDYGATAEIARDANRRLVEARSRPELVPVDSAGALFAWAWVVAGAEPRSESVRSLIQTADISRLKRPELQQAMTAYLARVQEADRYENELLRSFGEIVRGLFDYVDLTDAVSASLTPEELGPGLTWEAHSPEYVLGLDPARVDQEAHAAIPNPEVQKILSTMLALKTDVRLQQIEIRRATSALLDQVVAALQ